MILCSLEAQFTLYFMSGGSGIITPQRMQHEWSSGFVKSNNPMIIFHNPGALLYSLFVHNNLISLYYPCFTDEKIETKWLIIDPHVSKRQDPGLKTIRQVFTINLHIPAPTIPPSTLSYYSSSLQILCSFKAWFQFHFLSKALLFHSTQYIFPSFFLWRPYPNSLNHVN